MNPDRICDTCGASKNEDAEMCNQCLVDQGLLGDDLEIDL